MSRPIRWLLCLAGGLSLFLGLLGVVLPLLPTTPFILLSAACFYHGSPRIHNWMLSHPWMGQLIGDWQRHRAIRRRSKRMALALIVITFSISISLVPSLHKWLLFTLMLVCLFFVSRLKVMEEKPPA